MSRFAVLALLGCAGSFVGTLVLASAFTVTSPPAPLLALSTGLFLSALASAAAAHGDLTRRPMAWVVIYPIASATYGLAAVTVELLARISPVHFAEVALFVRWIGGLTFLAALAAFVGWAKSDAQGRMRWWP